MHAAWEKRAYQGESDRDAALARVAELEAALKPWLHLLTPSEDDKEDGIQDPLKGLPDSHLFELVVWERENGIGYPAITAGQARRSRAALTPKETWPMTDNLNACDLAIAREKAARQALEDRASGDPTKPVNASFTLTGEPTDEQLEAELSAALAKVDAACQGKGPSQ